MSTGQTSENEKGTWAMGVGEREEALRFIERMTEESGGSLRSLLDKVRARDGMDLARDVGKVLATLDRGGIAVGYREPDSFQDVRGYMKGTFVSPYDVMRLHGRPYTHGSLQSFYGNIPPMIQILGIMHRGYGLVAGPPDPMTPGEVCVEFKMKTSIESLYEMVTGKEDKVYPRWYAIRLEPVANSSGKTFVDAKVTYLQKDERLPNLAEIAWFAGIMRQVNKRVLYVGSDAYRHMCIAATWISTSCIAECSPRGSIRTNCLTHDRTSFGVSSSPGSAQYQCSSSSFGEGTKLLGDGGLRTAVSVWYSSRMKPVVAAIAAVGRNRVLGKENKLLWHIPDDLKRFKELSEGHPIILGRKTFESIVGYLGKPLPNRQNIVVTRDSDWKYEGVVTASTVEEALEIAKELDQEWITIGGGAQIYEAAMPYTTRLCMTFIDAEAEGDTFFPPFEGEFTKEIFREDREWNGLKYSWVDLERA
jgi:dihydrofolate reductase